MWGSDKVKVTSKTDATLALASQVPLEKPGPHIASRRRLALPAAKKLVGVTVDVWCALTLTFRGAKLLGAVTVESKAANAGVGELRRFQEKSKAAHVVRHFHSH